MLITYLAEIKSVLEVRARVDLLCQVIHEQVQEEVDIGVQHSDLLAELVIQKHVKIVPI